MPATAARGGGLPVDGKKVRQVELLPVETDDGVEFVAVEVGEEKIAVNIQCHHSGVDKERK